MDTLRQTPGDSRQNRKCKGPEVEIHLEEQQGDERGWNEVSERGSSRRYAQAGCRTDLYGHGGHCKDLSFDAD